MLIGELDNKKYCRENRSPHFNLVAGIRAARGAENMAGTTPVDPEDYSLFMSENGHLSFENPNYQLEPIGSIDSARMEDHLNSNIEQNVPLSVYEELYQELEGMNHLSNTGRAGGSRRGYATLDITSMGVDVEKGPVTQPIKDTNKMSESIAEKTAKLHRLLGDGDNKLDAELESPESEKLTDSVSEKDISHTQINNDIYAIPVKRRTKKNNQLPAGWEKHEDSEGAYYWHIKSGTIQRDIPKSSDTQDQVSNIIRNVRSSKIFDTDFEAGNVGTAALDKDLVPGSGMQKSCTASSINNIGMERNEKDDTDGSSSKKEEEKWKRRSLPAGKIQEEVSSGGGFKPMQVSVQSLGYCELAESDLTPENSSKAVNRCIVQLSSKKASSLDLSSVWGEGRDIILELDEGSLKLIDPLERVVLNSQPIHAIRVWGVGRDNNQDFAYVSRDKVSRKHMCHVFRCQLPARSIANTLRDICKKILIERSLAQSSSKLTEKLVDKRDKFLTRPTTLAVDESNASKKLGTAAPETFPTPMEEPRKVVKAWYLGSIQVSQPGGMDTINVAIQEMVDRVGRADWKTVAVAVAPSTVSVSFMDGSDAMECRVRFLSFLGIGENVQQCAFIMHTAQDTFMCHVFHCEPTAGPLCKTIEAACKLRYQKCLDARPAARTEGDGESSRNSIGATIKNMFGALTKKRSPELGVS